MDREKIINQLETDYREAERRGWILVPVGRKIVKDAIALLKEQEAVEPITQSSVYDPDTWFYVCGSCKKSVIDRGDKFCRWCGKPVLWEGR